VLGQVVAPKGVNEIRPLELLALVALSGPLMMGASVHCQSENGNLIADHDRVEFTAAWSGTM
jgi:hypothetical protein